MSEEVGDVGEVGFLWAKMTFQLNNALDFGFWHVIGSAESI